MRDRQELMSCRTHCAIVSVIPLSRANRSRHTQLEASRDGDARGLQLQHHTGCHGDRWRHDVSRGPRELLSTKLTSIRSWVFLSWFGRRDIYLAGIVLEACCLLPIGVLGLIAPTDAILKSLGGLLTMINLIFHFSLGPVCRFN